MATMQTQREQQPAYPSAANQANGRGEEKLVQQDANSRSAPKSPRTPGAQQSPKTKDGQAQNISPGERGSNLKAEAFADAHARRVQAEAQAYIASENRIAEVVADKDKWVSDNTRRKEVQKANELRKREDERAEELIRQAQVKAEKSIEQAKEKASLMKANTKEVAEKRIAQINTLAEREKAAIDEEKSKKFAEIKDKAETMIASGELAEEPAHRGVRQRLKENLICSA